MAFSTRANASYRILGVCSVLVFVFALIGCGGSQPIPVATPISVSLNQLSVTVLSGGQSQFTATIHGTSNLGITWSVDGVGGGSSATGTTNSSGLYTAPSQQGIHNVTATSIADTTKSATATVTVIDFELVPAAATVDPLLTQQFTVIVPGSTAPNVTWSIDGIAGGNAVTGTVSSSGLYTAPSRVGSHKITATVATAPSVSVNAILTVIDDSPGAVLTYHNDDARDGAFTQEITLAPSNVNQSQFGKLLSYPVDGQIYAQPLYLPQVTIPGFGLHDIVYVATQNNTVYAFDASGSQTSPLWLHNLGPSVSKGDVTGVNPVVGILSTPVIDPTTHTIYVLAETAGTNPPFWLHALDVTTGDEKFGGPVAVTGSVSGTEGGSLSHAISLGSDCYQRMGLALDPVTNAIYIPFGSCTHGWILAYDKKSLKQTAIFNDTSNNNGGGGLWASGGAPAIDDVTGDLYLMSGVDQGDDIASGNSTASGYNDAFLRLNASDLSVLDYFMPDDNPILAENDVDLGSGSNILLPGSSSFPHETIGGGKDGNIFVVNRDHMGAYNFEPPLDDVIQVVHTGTRQYDNIFSTPVYWNGNVYYHCNQDVLRAFSWTVNAAAGLQLSAQPTSLANPIYTMHGATASLSANGVVNGIIWDIDNSNYDQNIPAQSGPSVLHAYDATNVAVELYNSSEAGDRDTAGLALKFTVPTIAGGRVFVPTSTELDVYGLLTP